jgi:hypothetical protein
MHSLWPAGGEGGGVGGGGGGEIINIDDE